MSNSSEYSRRYREKHPEKRKESIRKYKEKNKDKIREASRQYYQENRDKILDSLKQYNKTPSKYAAHLKHRYNLSLENYNLMVEAQNNLCAICGKPDKEGVNLSVDHCHKTGKIRALLCRLCNRAIGLLKDDPELVQKAANYLKDHA